MLQTKYDKLWADSLYTQEFSSVAQSALTLCSPMDCSTPGFPDHHQLLELAQTHVLQVGDPSNGLILCHPLLLLPSDFPSISILSNESVFCIRWTKYWSFSISASNEYSGLVSYRMDWLDLLAFQGILKSLLQHHISKASILWCSAFFKKIFFNFDWRLITLQYCSGFCHTLTWHPTSVLLPGKSHGQRSLVGCSPWGH